jgi:hypothetical protein
MSYFSSWWRPLCPFARNGLRSMLHVTETKTPADPIRTDRPERLGVNTCRSSGLGAHFVPPTPDEEKTHREGHADDEDGRRLGGRRRTDRYKSNNCRGKRQVDLDVVDVKA